MDQRVAIVTSVRRQSADVVTIYFTLDDGSILEYEAGQYITVFFENTSHPEGKAYSLSSRPSARRMSITVKRVGEYSARLHTLAPSDHFMISSAYGFFGPRTTASLTCLAGGVGIAPIWSVIKHTLELDADRPIQLWYSNARADSVAFRRAISERNRVHREFAVHHHITRQQCVMSDETHGRIDLDRCVEVACEAEQYLVCGSVTFVRDMWRGLLARGVSERAISTEVFFE
ncbi:MAG: FAD-binding oxidoreductase [Candidatus Saccharimonas sp.]